jgi:hypothetical protein
MRRQQKVCYPIERELAVTVEVVPQPNDQEGFMVLHRLSVSLFEAFHDPDQLVMGEMKRLQDNFQPTSRVLPHRVSADSGAFQGGPRIVIEPHAERRKLKEGEVSLIQIIERLLERYPPLYLEDLPPEYPSSQSAPTVSAPRPRTP